MVSTFSNTAGSSAILGNQMYGPYGNKRYSKGSMGTDKGFTGQYNDALSGLDYYNARYYDPVSARFVSADTVEGNLSGMDPYAYVNGNPETKNDPTGHMIPSEELWGNDGTVIPETPKPAPTDKQIYSWCQHNRKCTNALDHYENEREAATNNLLQGLLIGVYTFVKEGNLEEFEETVEKIQNEGLLTAEEILDQLPEDSPYLAEIRAKLASSLPGDQLEGELGALVSKYSNSPLKSFNKQYTTPTGRVGNIGETDAENEEIIFEAKGGNTAKGEGEDIVRKAFNTVSNPDGKPLVVYAPNWNRNQVLQIARYVRASNPNIPVFIVQNPAQLIAIVQYYQNLPS